MECYEEDVRGLVRFLADSPTAFHAVEGFARLLEESGYRELPEREHWDIRPGGNYYTVRNGSSIAAFQVGSTLGDYSFKVAASHSDSPHLQAEGESGAGGAGPLHAAQHRRIRQHPLLHLDGPAPLCGGQGHCQGGRADSGSGWSGSTGIWC